MYSAIIPCVNATRKFMYINALIHSWKKIISANPNHNWIKVVSYTNSFISNEDQGTHHGWRWLFLKLPEGLHQIIIQAIAASGARILIDDFRIEYCGFFCEFLMCLLIVYPCISQSSLAISNQSLHLRRIDRTSDNKSPSCKLWFNFSSISIIQLSTSNFQIL